MLRSVCLCKCEDVWVLRSQHRCFYGRNCPLQEALFEKVLRGTTVPCLWGGIVKKNQYYKSFLAFVAYSFLKSHRRNSPIKGRFVLTITNNSSQHLYFCFEPLPLYAFHSTLTRNRVMLEICRTAL